MRKTILFAISLLILIPNLCLAEPSSHSPSGQKKAESDVIAFMNNLKALANTAENNGRLSKKDANAFLEENMDNLSKAYNISKDDISQLMDFYEKETPLPKTYRPPCIPNMTDKNWLHAELRRSMDYYSQKMEKAKPKESEIEPASGKLKRGMSKVALYKIYNPLQQVSYRKAGTEEWIVFRKWSSGKPDDTIMFYLQGGLVRNWTESNSEMAEKPNKTIKISEDSEIRKAKPSPIYLGMTKEALYKVFPESQRKGYQKDENEEWITFSDLQRGEPDATITFHLKDGKVKGWDKED